MKKKKEKFGDNGDEAMLLGLAANEIELALMGEDDDEDETDADADNTDDDD